MGLPQAGRDTLAEALSDPQRATSLEEVQPSSLRCLSHRTGTSPSSCRVPEPEL